MRITLLLLLTLLCTPMLAQSWSYVGGSCPNTQGSARIKIKSNGNIISASFSTNQMYVREWNGSAWTDLPAPATTGTIGIFQLEMFQDTAYLGISNSGFKVFKWNGSGWTQLGPTITGTFAEGNHEFLLDNNGVPFVCHSTNRNIYRFNGTAWPVVKNLPQGGFPIIFTYNYGIDNAMTFNSQNELMYSVIASNRQFFKKLNANFEEVLVGDTAARVAPFTFNFTTMKRNANGEIFALFTKFGSRSFVKKLNGNTWELYGDSSTFGLPSGFTSMEFATPSTLVMGVGGSVDKKIWMCSGQNAPFQQLDLVSHTGNFYQFTDLDISPADGKPYVAFNCTPTHSVMRYDSPLTSIEDLLAPKGLVEAFPNPSANGVFNIVLPENQTEMAAFSLLGIDGKIIETGILKPGLPQTIDLSHHPAGLYSLKIRINNRVEVRRLSRL